MNNMNKLFKHKNTRQEQIYKFLKESCGEGYITSKMTTVEVGKLTGNDGLYTQRAILALKKKGAIITHEAKSGYHGWTQYEIPELKEALAKETALEDNKNKDAVIEALQAQLASLQAQIMELK